MSLQSPCETPWTNKRAIKLDLSFAQSRRVPGDVKFTTGDLPPVPAVPQVTETEEEYFKTLYGFKDGDSMEPSNGPDLGLIKHMLKEVRESAGASNFESGDSETIQITKLDPTVPEFVPNKAPTGDIASNVLVNNNEEITPVEKPPVKKVKQRTNIAVDSILKALAVETATKEHNGNKTNNEMKLLKPEDFVLTEQPGITQSVEKVKGWLNAQENSLTPVLEIEKKELNGKMHRSPLQIDNKEPLLKYGCQEKMDTKKLLTLDPTAMFKKKKSVTVNETPVIKSVTSPPPPSVIKNYVPTTKASENYQRYQQQIKLMTIVHEDLWTKAQREMREIDARKKREQEVLALLEEMARAETPISELTGGETEESSTMTEEQKLDMVRLPMVRHTLPEECIVCKVVSKRLVRDTMESTGFGATTNCELIEVMKRLTKQNIS